MKTRIVLPYPGEFGWELMNWQARVRALAAASTDRFLILAPPDKLTIYAAHSSETSVPGVAGTGRAAPGMIVRSIEGIDWEGCANEDHRLGNDGAPLARAPALARVRALVRPALERLNIDPGDAEYLAPPMDGTLWPTRTPHQHFVDYRAARPIECDVLLVPRHRTSAADRNQPGAWWDDLASALIRRGLRVAMYAPRADVAIGQLSSCRLAAGASTGGLHLAALCQCPHYVWGSGAEARWTRLQITNRQRYETVWNPFGTPCRYDEYGWSPPMERAADGCLRALDAIGLGADGPEPQRRWNARWRFRRSLLGVLHRSPRRWPWRLESLVRERLV